LAVLSGVVFRIERVSGRFSRNFPLIISLKRHLIRGIGDEDKGRNNLFKVMPTRSPTYAIGAWLLAQ
jgi:hypothetical protein